MPSFTFGEHCQRLCPARCKDRFCGCAARHHESGPALCTRRDYAAYARYCGRVHYAGVCCDMDALGDIAREHGLAMVEDAAQAVGSFYKDRPAGLHERRGAASASTKPRTTPWVRAARSFSTTRTWWSAPRLSAKKARTAAASTGDRWINILGWTSAPPSCPASSTPALPACAAGTARVHHRRAHGPLGAVRRRAGAAGTARPDRAHEGTC